MKECIECGLCTKHCEFLAKYSINLKEFRQRRELAYHCFMCGKCKHMCPVDIDGREIALNLRVQRTEENKGKISEKGYSGLILEKKNYIFKNYKNIESYRNSSEVCSGDLNQSNKKIKKSVLFTGCNFLSYMPDTAKQLIKILKDKNIPTVFDCCGKPIYELGLTKEGKDIIKRLQDNIIRYEIDEMIMVCPNCYYYLRGKLDVKITDIYTKLKELGIGSQINRDITIYRPCPDRDTEDILNNIKPFISGKIKNINEQCCGAGGCASGKEKEIAKNMKKDVKNQISDKTLSTYCATCTGFFGAEAIPTLHILSEILGVKEGGGRNSLLNRMKFKF